MMGSRPSPLEGYASHVEMKTLPFMGDDCPSWQPARQAGRQPASQAASQLFFVYKTRKRAISKKDGIYHIIKIKVNNKNVCYITFMLFDIFINL